jgi:RNA polymerase sigma-70 factor (ECF subfamily)
MSTINQAFQITEDTLVKGAREGSLEAFNQLVLTYQDLAYQQAFFLLGDCALAEAATQEAFIKAFQGIKKFRNESFRAWLLKIVTQSAHGVQRQSQRHPAPPQNPEDEDGDETESPTWLADEASADQTRVEQNKLSRILRGKVDELPEAYRSVITLIDLFEFDYIEAANALKIPVSAVKRRLAHARLQIAGSIRGDGS